MTIQRTYFDWVHSGLDFTRPPYESCSPNLAAFRKYLDEEWPGGSFLGCEGDRTIRQGVTQSEHSWGAAFDWRYPAGAGPEIAWFAVEYSAEIGLCGIHDYLGDRIWHADRTGNVADAHGLWWKKQNGAGAGMGEAWADYFHFVTTFTAFHLTTPIRARLPNQPPPPPPTEDDMAEIRRVEGSTATLLIAGNTATWIKAGAAVPALAADGLAVDHTQNPAKDVSVDSLKGLTLLGAAGDYSTEPGREVWIHAGHFAAQIL